MATLDDLKTVLESINTNISSQSIVMTNILASQESMKATQERMAQLASVDRSSSNQTGSNSTSSNNANGGIGARVGAGLGAVGAGAASAAGGIGALGIAMPAFFGGLLLGDQALGWLSTFGGGFDFANLKAAAIGFTDVIQEIDKEALIVLGGLMAVSAIGGTKAAAGLGTMGFAISAFLGGLLAGDLVFSEVSALGGSIDFSSLGTVLGGFSSAIGQLTPEAATTLAGIIGASGVAAAFGGGAKEALGTAAIMTGIGAGISGLMIGLAAGNAGIEWINDISGASGDGLASAFKMFNDSVGELNNENAIIALGAILAAGTAIGAIAGASGPGALFVAGGIGMVMAGIGAGIAGLFIGLAAGGKIVDLIESIPGGDGDGLVSVFKMFNDSVLAITPAAIDRLKDLTSLGGTDILGALSGLSAAVVAMFGASGLTSIGGMITDGLKNTVDYIFGTNYAEKPSIFQQLVDGLAPIKDFDITPINAFANTLDTLTNSFERLANIDVEDGIQKNIFGMMKNIGGVMGIMPFLLRGGYYRGESFGYGDNIDFGPEGEGGLLALRDEDLELLKRQISKLHDALNISGVVPENTMSGISAVNSAGSSANSKPVNVIIDQSDKSIKNTSVSGGSNATTVYAFGSSRNDLDFLSLPAGAQ